jgi:formate--tetrahydrofolate ligase
MLSNLEIAQAASLMPITGVAEKYFGLDSEYLELYGKYIAKISLDVLRDYDVRPKAKYIAVTAITPTPLGEGKTVTTIGLSMALNRLGHRAVCAVREPSIGPLFGIKGGGAGSGYSQIVPMDKLNLHLTGDSHAIGLANNLLAAFIDNSILKYNKMRIDPFTVTWRRCVDVSDRALRDIVTGLGGREDGYPRETGFDITAASEVMAILALSTGIKDLRKRLGNIVIGYDYEGKPVTSEQLKCSGAMAALLIDSIRPNLMQTIENTPAIVHTGPFGNIAHGSSSIIADYIGLRLADYVVTESGFGADCGAEKFTNIKCRYSGLKPDAFVLVTTVRALKMHSGRFNVLPGKPLDKNLTNENLKTIKEGSGNLEKQIENVLSFGVPVVIAINRHESDTEREIKLVKDIAKRTGACAGVESTVYRDGGAGGVELAEAIKDAASKKSKFKFLYPLDVPIKEKIETIAKKMYGAGKIEYSILADKQIDLYTRCGFGHLPICMAKTHLSLSEDPHVKGRPEGFRIHVREVKAAVGAGYLYPILGEMRTMPGLPSVPAGTKVDIDDTGKIVGLF